MVCKVIKSQFIIKHNEQDVSHVNRWWNSINIGRWRYRFLYAHSFNISHTVCVSRLLLPQTPRAVQSSKNHAFDQAIELWISISQHTHTHKHTRRMDTVIVSLCNFHVALPSAVQSVWHGIARAINQRKAVTMLESENKNKRKHKFVGAYERWDESAVVAITLVFAWWRGWQRMPVDWRSMVNNMCAIEDVA